MSSHRKMQELNPKVAKLHPSHQKSASPVDNLGFLCYNEEYFPRIYINDIKNSQTSRKNLPQNKAKRTNAHAREKIFSGEKRRCNL
jgi:hypothetical protein